MTTLQARIASIPAHRKNIFNTTVKYLQEYFEMSLEDAQWEGLKKLDSIEDTSKKLSNPNSPYYFPY